MNEPSWKSVPLEDLCELITVGIVIQPSKYYVENGVRAFRSLNVKNGAVNDSSWVYLSEEGHRLNKKSEVQEGDVLIIRSGDAGKACVVPREFSGLNCIDLIIARPNRKTILSEHIAEFFNSPQGVRHVAAVQGGMAQKHLNVSAAKRIPIPVPPLQIQQEISNFGALATHRQNVGVSLLEGKIERKRGLMQQLLSGEKRLPGFTEEWQEVRLDQVATNSSLRNKDSVPDERLYAVTKAKGLIPMREHVKGVSTDRCQVVKHNWFAYNPMRLNIGSISRLLEEEPVMVSPDYVVFHCKEDRLDPDYLDHLRQTTRWQHFVNVAGNGSVRVRIYFKDLGAFKFLLPPIEEQHRIAEILNTCDREIALHRRQLEAIREQKRGLMQKLLTGEVRVRI